MDNTLLHLPFTHTNCTSVIKTVLTIFNLWKSHDYVFSSKVTFHVLIHNQLIVLRLCISLAFITDSACISLLFLAIVEVCRCLASVLHTSVSILKVNILNHLLYPFEHHIVFVDVQMYHIASFLASQWCSFSHPCFSPGSILVLQVHSALLLCQHLWPRGSDRNSGFARLLANHDSAFCLAKITRRPTCPTTQPNTLSDHGAHHPPHSKSKENLLSKETSHCIKRRHVFRVSLLTNSWYLLLLHFCLFQCILHLNKSDDHCLLALSALTCTSPWS